MEKHNSKELAQESQAKHSHAPAPSRRFEGTIQWRFEWSGDTNRRWKKAGALLLLLIIGGGVMYSIGVRNTEMLEKLLKALPRLRL